ncbi:MAG TPA: hypothetical protein PLB10_01250 [Thiolinea sp.]|nr:hypothetical protein [Thiolinea sp.]
MNRSFRFFVLLVLVGFCASPALAGGKAGQSLRVDATAYNSLPAQTDDDPNVAAWGDELKPGMKAIAVSRDLLNFYGLKHRDKVRISGMDGEFEVLDKMHRRWEKKIDIYMGKDRRKALRFGRKRVTISW